VPTFETSAVTAYWQSPSPFRPYRDGNTLRYRIGIGITVLRVDGQWHNVYDPSEELVSAADRVYRGGRVHPVTTAQAAELTAAGYGAYIT
jgi:hypothetical protein